MLKFRISVFLWFALCAIFFVSPVFSQSISVEYLCEIGISLYQQGKYDDALHEFEKALLLDPQNRTAKQYIDIIFKEDFPAPLAQEVETPVKETVKKIEVKSAKIKEVGITLSAIETKPSQEITEKIETLPAKEKIIEDTFAKLKQRPEPVKEPEEKTLKEKEQKKTHLKIKGISQLGLGFTSQDTIWKRANFDLNERNWRMLSDAALNQRFNTYDYRIFDRLSLDLDTDNEEGFNFHSNITVDPWSFTGKSQKVTVTSTQGDLIEVELKYWSNTGYTLNETVYSSLKGNTFSLPELKVKDGKTDPFNIAGAFSPADSASFSSIEIERSFQPIREFWLDYNKEGVNFRVFPMAYQDQALISDDPLAITNHHIWWENSMWLKGYRQGIYNSGATPVDFTKGAWDNHLVFLSRESGGNYITTLRGLSFGIQPDDETSFTTTIATPKHLWQDYDVVDNLISASRFNHYLLDNLLVGSTFTTRTAFNIDEGTKTDSRNYVGGLDVGYEITEGLKTFAEVLTSRSDFDLTSPDYRTKSRGNALYFSLISRYPGKSIMDLKYGYDEIKLNRDESFLLKTKFYAAHMDEGFYSALSSFHNTRQDTFWSRHISFRRSFDYYYAGLLYPGINLDEVNAIRIGDGIDFGRDVLGFRAEFICEDKYDNLFDVRNVHNVNGKYIETVARDEARIKINNKLTLKLLGIYQDLPKTKGGIDPFIIDGDTGDFAADWSSDPIDDGKDPTLKTGSLGLEYTFTDWLAANGIWERTNDYTLAYGNFPRSVLNSGQLGNLGAYTYEYGKKYRYDLLYLYDQQLFPQPPYPFYDIYKLGLRLTPIKDKLELYLDYTRNEYEIAGQNSDNMNHVGLEVTYMPTKKLGGALKYTYSRWKDLDRLRAGVTKPVGHHNLFFELRYLISKEDDFLFQFGESNVSPIGYMTYDPYGGTLLTIDTQHIVRLYYRRRF